VDVVITRSSFDASSTVLAMDPPSSSGRDPALLLDVDVDELSGPLAFVANDGARRAVEISQTWRPEPT
jgi:hypothetical protein